MAELTHDGADDGFHEIQLSGKQLALLVMMTLSGIVLTFLLGVQVGRGVRAERGEDIDAAPVATASTEPLPTGTPAEPPVPTAEVPLSYPDRLVGAPANESLKPKAETPAPVQQAAPAAPPATDPAPPAGTPQPPAAAPAAAAATKSTAPAPPSRTRTAASVPTSGRSGRWVVQVITLSNRAGAAEVTQRLIAKGYPAFMFLPRAGTPELYRVQVGRYSDRNEADRIARRLSREEDFKPEVKR